MDHLCCLQSYVSHCFASVHCCLVVTCWERADLLALVGDVNLFLLYSLWYPGSGVVHVLDCIVSCSLPPLLLCNLNTNCVIHQETICAEAK